MHDNEYRPLLGCDYYRIGSDGSIWSRLIRGHAGALAKRWKRLKGWDEEGYRRIRLCVDGVNKVYKVHQLVLLTFVGPCPDGCWGLHRDGNPSNNCVSNLRWGTPAENADDRERHGRHVKGSAKENAKLSPADVAEVVALRKTGLLHREIAERFGCHQSSISRILGRKRYRRETASAGV